MIRKDAIMTMRRYATLLLLLSPLWCGAAELDISIARKRMTVMDGGAYVTVEGTWRRISTRPSINTPTINTVSIECDRARRVCEEYMAKVLQPTDDPAGNLGVRYLFVDRTIFRVLEWSRTVLEARAEYRAADIDLRISLAEQTAERRFRETGARGAQGADPSRVDQWVLE
jgi:hypothetical protein